MYTPPAFALDDLQVIHEFIDHYSFGLLVSRDSHEPLASHLPLLLDRSRGTHGVLRGHMAVENAQWKTAADQQVLVVFSGPHAYISPEWYAEDHTVPTWNYIAVHAYGALRVIQDDAAIESLLMDSIQRFESEKSRWSIDPGSEFFQRMAQMVVSFEIPIARLEGKWKLSQNHSTVRRRRVIEKLEQSSDPQAREIAAHMSPD